MAYDYDTLYRDTKHALGAPTREFVTFFQPLAGRCLDVLDVGCGQGRDALMLLRAGHRVVGVDLSPHGIADIEDFAAREGLAFQGHVSDITTFSPDARFDVVLIDRTLHMLADAVQETVLARLIMTLRPQGWLLIADEKRNLPRFRAVLDQSGQNWSIFKDKAGYLFAQNPAHDA